MMARWLKNKKGGKPPPEAKIIQMALRLHVLPDAFENLDTYWFSRLEIYFSAENEVAKIQAD